MMCTARPRKYLPQPLRRCPVFCPRPQVLARGPAGITRLVWFAERLAAPLGVLADGAGGLRGPLPASPARATPGDALCVVDGGARFIADPSHGALLAYAVEGVAALRAQSRGCVIELCPIE